MAYFPSFCLISQSILTISQYKLVNWSMQRILSRKYAKPCLSPCHIKSFLKAVRAIRRGLCISFKLIQMFLIVFEGCMMFMKSLFSAVLSEIIHKAQEEHEESMRYFRETCPRLSCTRFKIKFL